MMGLSTSGIISLGCALVAGRKRVPSPAAGKTTLQTFRLMNPRAMVDNFTSLREPVPPLRGSVRFSTLPSTPPAAPCWARLSRPCGAGASELHIAERVPRFTFAHTETVNYLARQTITLLPAPLPTAPAVISAAPAPAQAASLSARTSTHLRV